MVRRRTGLDPLSYMGVEPSTPSKFVQEPRNPTDTDYDGFNLMNVWLNTSTRQIWMLVNKANFIATWHQFISDVGAVNTLTGDVNPAVAPTGNNINIQGSAPFIFTGTAAPASILTLSSNGTIATQYTCDGPTVAVPAGGNLNIIGAGGLTTSGAGSTITITPGGGLASQVICDGPTTAAPAGGKLNVLGGNNITTTGDGASTVTVDVTGTTDFAIQRGNATGSLTSLAVGTDGQVLIGATGASAAFATMTSAGGTILFTPGANTLNLESGGAAVTVPTDSGTATVAAGVLEVKGKAGGNISTSAPGASNLVDISVSGTANFNPQMGNAAGSLDDIGTMTDGDLVIGSTGVAPAVAQLTAGAGIAIVNGPGAITVSATGGATGNVIRTVFNASGTWTKNANTKWVRYVIYSGGGGGGSGARADSAPFSQTTVAGGGGGSCLGYTEYGIDVDSLGATEAVTIGALAAGGAGQAVDDMLGNAGAQANQTLFGTTNPLAGGKDIPNANTAGPGGRLTSTQTPGAQAGIVILEFTGTRVLTHLPPLGAAGGGSNLATGGLDPTSNIAGVQPWGCATGGGGGGSFQSGGTNFRSGGDGGKLPSEDTAFRVYGTAGLGGATGVSGTNGPDASAQNSPWKLGGAGGGGGGAHATNPGAGGDGGLPGGGGGGGGSVMNGNLSGAGGDGSQGQVIIYEFTG